MPQSLRIRWSMPKEIVMVGLVDWEEKEKNVLLSLSRTSFDGGVSDSRLAGQCDFGSLRIKQFFPGSGCGVIIEGNKLVFAEPGLQDFVGKSVGIVPPFESESLKSTTLGHHTIIVWSDESYNVRTFVDSEGNGVFKTLLPILDGLCRLFL